MTVLAAVPLYPVISAQVLPDAGAP